MRYEESTAIVRSRGFNIIELMITVAIVGIVALIAIPNMNRLVESQRVRAIANDMATAVSLARSEAVKNSVDMRVLALNDANGAPDFDVGWCVVRANAGCANGIRTFNTGNLELNVTGNNMDVRFDRQGARISNSDQRFLFFPVGCTTGMQRARQVDIRPSGRPMVTEEDCP